MTTITARDERSDADSGMDADMAAYGIARVPVDYFHYREFRYTNLKDAITQAKRDRQGAMKTTR